MKASSSKSILQNAGDRRNSASSAKQIQSQDATSVSTPSTPVPRPIKRLDEALINRIAAGEIIHRPASALKELIENALDARSTSIRVSVKDGGLKLLQVQDNGSGIQKASLPLLAARFATSKISSFSDLSSLQSYGFRGEALASISHVAHLSVITKVRDEGCAWKAHYSDGVLCSPKGGISPDPKPCAGNDGTTIIIEDLFYNVPLRLQAMKSVSEEYSRILDVITKYATHNASVSFGCKKASSTSSDISTPSGNTVKQNISLLYGSAVAKALSHVLISSGATGCSNGKGAERRSGRKGISDLKGKRKAVVLEDEEETRIEMDVDEDERDEYEEGSQNKTDDDEIGGDNVTWKGEAYITGINYHAKKMMFLLFINHRLVESPKLKKSIESVYSSVLPKGSLPFVYLSLQIDSKFVDVNVHPTKREVYFLDEEAIFSSVCDAIQEALVKDSGSRTFKYQTLLPSGSSEGKEKEKRGTDKTQKMIGDTEDTEDVEDVEEIPEKKEKYPLVQKVYSHHKVRTSAKDRTIDSMFPILNKSQVVESTESPGSSKIPEIEESKCILTSIQNLRDEVVQNRHEGLTDILKKHVFVGVVGLDKCLSLVQHNTKLYIVNHASLGEELFYQLGLRQFGNFGEFRLDPPAPIPTLLSFAVENEDGIEEAGLKKDQVVTTINGILCSHKEMLKEYFSICINDDAQIETIPLLLKGYTPNLDKLPLFLMRLGPEVNWKTERECFDTLLRELAYFYAPGPTLSHMTPTTNGEYEGATDVDANEDEDIQSEKWQIEHVVFAATRKYFHAPKKLLERDVVQVASLPDLYKVFERC